jgi:hypothetical protein
VTLALEVNQNCNPGYNYIVHSLMAVTLHFFETVPPEVNSAELILIVVPMIQKEAC